MANIFFRTDMADLRQGVCRNRASRADRPIRQFYATAPPARYTNVDEIPQARFNRAADGVRL